MTILELSKTCMLTIACISLAYRFSYIYSAVSQAASARRRPIDNFNSPVNEMMFLEAEYKSNTTTACGGERLSDQGCEPIWRNGAEFAGGEEVGEGIGDERVQECKDRSKGGDMIEEFSKQVR